MLFTTSIIDFTAYYRLMSTSFHDTMRLEDMLSKTQTLWRELEMIAQPVVVDSSDLVSLSNYCITLNILTPNGKLKHCNIQIEEGKPGNQKQRDCNISWASVARKSTELPQTYLSAIPLPKKPDGNNKEAEVNNRKEPKRVFLKLGPDHAWPKLSPIVIKKVTTEKAGITATSLTALYSVRSGYTMECVSDARRDAILKVGKSLGDRGAIIEAASDWTSSLVSEFKL
ncbi:hypothetical protein HI914_01623 [Erysiphe necator]|nr:hypothetical protein HI914_01623 [Erysiphe necator]